MRNLNKFIIERLKLNKDTKVSSKMDQKEVFNYDELIEALNISENPFGKLIEEDNIENWEVGKWYKLPEDKGDSYIFVTNKFDTVKKFFGIQIVRSIDNFMHIRYIRFDSNFSQENFDQFFSMSKKFLESFKIDNYPENANQSFIRLFFNTIEEAMLKTGMGIGRVLKDKLFTNDEKTEIYLMKRK